MLAAEIQRLVLPHTKAVLVGNLNDYEKGSLRHRRKNQFGHCSKEEASGRFALMLTGEIGADNNWFHFWTCLYGIDGIINEVCLHSSTSPCTRSFDYEYAIEL